MALATPSFPDHEGNEFFGGVEPNLLGSRFGRGTHQEPSSNPFGANDRITGFKFGIDSKLSRHDVSLRLCCYALSLQEMLIDQPAAGRVSLIGNAIHRFSDFARLGRLVIKFVRTEEAKCFKGTLGERVGCRVVVWNARCPALFAGKRIAFP